MPAVWGTPAIAARGGSSMRSISRPGDGLGQQLAHGDRPSLAGRQLGGAVEAAGAARRLDQLLQPDLQRLRDLDQHRQRRVGGARLQVRPGRARHAGHARDLLLGPAARLAQRLDVAAEVQRRSRSRRVTAAIANNMAACQYIGNPVDIIVRAGVS